ncbi:hypothetical protein T10_2035, partial [Trichinella papuae]
LSLMLFFEPICACLLACLPACLLACSFTARGELALLFQCHRKEQQARNFQFKEHAAEKFVKIEIIIHLFFFLFFSHFIHKVCRKYEYCVFIFHFFKIVIMDNLNVVDYFSRALQDKF